MFSRSENSRNNSSNFGRRPSLLRVLLSCTSKNSLPTSVNNGWWFCFFVFITSWTKNNFGFLSNCRLFISVDTAPWRLTLFSVFRFNAVSSFSHKTKHITLSYSSREKKPEKTKKLKIPRMLLQMLQSDWLHYSLQSDWLCYSLQSDSLHYSRQGGVKKTMLIYSLVFELILKKWRTQVLFLLKQLDYSLSIPMKR